MFTTSDFINWLVDHAFDENISDGAFRELTLRKLYKLGYIGINENEWEK